MNVTLILWKVGFSFSINISSKKIIKFENTFLQFYNNIGIHILMHLIDSIVESRTLLFVNKNNELTHMKW